MSCGNAHATPCHEVLALVYVFIDNEIDDDHRLDVVAHLSECTPCEGIYAREIAVKTRVRMALDPGPAPAEVRARIVSAVQEISVTYRLD